MKRTAEAFVHQLPDGMWFVGDYLRGQGVAAVYLWTDGTERTARSIQLARVDVYKHKASAKRAAQSWLKRIKGKG
jgi:hypothetical protein